MATSRDTLEAKATELGVEFTEDTTNAELKQLIADKEAADEGADADVDAGGDAGADAGKVETASPNKRGAKFVVFDSNGVQVRSAATEDEAAELAKVFSGRYSAK